MSASPILLARDIVLTSHPNASPFDFSVNAGEHWLIRGGAGSGKTPLIKTFAGLISPLAGELSLFGQSLDALAPNALLKLRKELSILFTHDGLLPAWTGFENLALPLKYHDSGSSQTIIAQVEAVAERYAIPDHWLDRPVTLLSPEQRLALALVRALITQPKLLLIDGASLDTIENFSGLRGSQLIRDAIAADCTVLVALPLELGQGIPDLFKEAHFRVAELRQGRLEWSA